MALAWSSGFASKVASATGFKESAGTSGGSYTPASITVSEIVKPSWTAIKPNIESGASTETMIAINDQLVRSNQLSSVSTQTQIHENLIGLGKASVDISQALGEQVAIREQQRQGTFAAIGNTNLALSELNKRLSENVVALGEASIEASEAISAVKAEEETKGFFDSFNLPSIGTGVMLAGAALLAFLLLKK
ncbi:MAG: hypothetical protein HOI53_03965 [Francisellaceae bacterium]|jgi:hypothetical protein|nr:hypothetical protein [Francisellaceae bacterium]